MHANWRRLQRRLVSLSVGGTTLGISSSFALISWGEILTNFLQLLASALASLIFGGNPSAFLR